MTARVFLGGPIQHATREDGFDPPLRRQIEAAVARLRGAGFEVYSAHLDEMFGAFETEFTPERVSHRDFNWMRNCDVYAAIIPRGPDGRPMRTDGTHVEIGWASAFEIPIVLFFEAGCQEELSFLVRGLHVVAAADLYEFDPVAGCVPDDLLAAVFGALASKRADRAPRLKLSLK